MLDFFKDLFGKPVYFGEMSTAAAGYKYKKIAKDYPIRAFLGNDAIYSLIDHIASNGSTLPVIFKKNGKEVDPESDTFAGLMSAPSARESRAEFLYQAVLYYELTGEVIIQKCKESVGFDDLTLRVIPTQSVAIAYSGGVPSKYRFTINGVEAQCEADEMIHLKRFNPDTTDDRGLSPMQPGQYIVDANNNLTVAESVILDNRGANNIIAGQSAEYPLAKKDKDALDHGLKGRIGGASNFNKAIVSAAPIKVHKLEMSPTDLGLVKTYPNQLRRLCTLIRLPAELFNAEGSGQFNTRREALKASYTECIIPKMETLLSGITRALLEEFGPGYTQEIDKSKVDALHPSPTEERSFWLELFADGGLSREKLHEILEIEDQGKIYANPKYTDSDGKQAKQKS
jgi:HK97 family phage portal protein